MQPTPPSLAAEAATAPATVIADIAVGAAYVARSQSHALPHLVKPAARVGVRLPWTPRLELGGALVGVLDSSEHYRVLGVVAQARWAFWQRRSFEFGATAALGAGRDADILHADLRADSSVAPYAVFAIDARWTLAGRWLAGVEASATNFAIAQAGALLGFRFGGSR